MKPPTLGLLPSTRLASTYFPPRCGPPQDEPHGPSHLGQIFRHVPDFPIYLDGTKPGTLHTNNLEAKFSTQLKLLAGNHHGRNGKTPTSHAGLVDVLKTNLPNNPVRITKQSLWGQDQLT